MELNKQIEWRDIPEYEGIYKVSEYGEVYSVTRVIYNSGKKQTRQGQVLSPGVDKVTFRKMYSLCKNGIKKNYSAANLVALAFLKNEQHFKMVEHIDNNPSNNHYSNLMWSTQSNNVINAFRDGLKSGKKGEKHHNTKLTECIVLEIKYSNLKNTELQKIYNVGKSCINDIKAGRTWKHIKC